VRSRRTPSRDLEASRVATRWSSRVMAARASWCWWERRRLLREPRAQRMGDRARARARARRRARARAVADPGWGGSSPTRPRRACSRAAGCRRAVTSSARRRSRAADRSVSARTSVRALVLPLGHPADAGERRGVGLALRWGSARVLADSTTVFALTSSSSVLGFPAHRTAHPHCARGPLGFRRSSRFGRHTGQASRSGRLRTASRPALGSDVDSWFGFRWGVESKARGDRARASRNGASVFRMDGSARK
jgi:hypothetical protein